MKSKLLLAASLLLFGFSNAQTPSWKPVNEGSLAGTEKTERASLPANYHLFSADLAGLKAVFGTAPSRSEGITSTVIIPLPDATGKIQHYRMYEAGVMQPGLAAAHSDMQSYAGQGIEDPAATIRISITQYGLHAMVLSPRGTEYIDPYTKDLKNYIVYRKADLTERRQFNCQVEESQNAHRTAASAQAVFSNDSSLRTYRLAMACTREYAAYHIAAAGVGGQPIAVRRAAVLAAMVVTVTRLNGVYEREVALTMQLVDNNESIIFITSDNFSNGQDGTLINESQTQITNIIGTENFDIGHTVGTGFSGLAQRGSVCNDGAKARGITGSNAPVGDTFDIDFVAHEIGHQFGASHTFNGTGGSCGGNENDATAVEPGSGTTIMAYAGLCEAGNVQSNSDDYFHTVNLEEIFELLQFTSCATETPIANTAPNVPSLSSRTIPKSTAFVLRSGNAVDQQGDAITYCWEQTNANGTNVNVPGPNNTSGPNFRSKPPVESRNRYMPELNDVLSGNLTPDWEIVPAVGRTLTFAVTVRDNNVLGGQTTRRNFTVNVNGTAGPFVVTSQSGENISWEQNSAQTVTWDVAGTNANNVNTSLVNILLSTDGGQTFTTVLAEGTANDGSETITVPNILATDCRIMVEAVNNIYYAVNQSVFAIGYSVSTECNTFTSNTAIAIPDNNPVFTTSSLAVEGIDSVSSVTVNVNATHTALGNLRINLINPEGTAVELWQGRCTLNDNMNITFSDEATTISPCGNTNGGNTYLPGQPLSGFNGQNGTGNWNLAFADTINSNTGTLNSWELTVCGQVFTPLAASQFNLKDFTLYPNPNNGSFTVQFAPDAQSAIGIAVHDMRGREVYKNNYTGSGLFSNTINLQNAQSGVYMVTVQNGTRKEVRKVVVK